MKRILFLKVFFSLFFLGNFSLKAQDLTHVTNGSNYTIEVNHYQAYGKIETDPTTVGEQTHTGVAVLNNNYSAAVNLGGAGGSCAVDATDANRWFTVNQRMGLLNGSINGYFNFSFRSWEDDGGNSCAYDSDDDRVSDVWGSRYATGSDKNQSEWFDHPDRSLNNNSIERFRSTWRYTNGTRASPLDFGTLTTGTKSHTNTNANAPTSAHASLGYSNEWSTNFRPGNDVTYKFVVPTGKTKRVTVSTDNSTTNTGMVDSYLYLLNASNTVIAYNDDGGQNNTSLLTKDLCPGTYYIVVDGYTATRLGKFQLTVTSSDISVTAGSIQLVTGGTSFFLCPSAAIPAISNVTSASSTVSAPTYKWYKQLRINGVAQGWVHYTAAGSGASATNLGTIENAEICWIARVANDCGTSVWSNQVIFDKYNVTINAGTLSADKTVPFPHEILNGTITSGVTNASASPNQVISWEKNVNSNGWVSADNSSNSQSYTLPAIISQSTQFRRKVVNSCAGVAYTSPMQVSVINPNGVLKGKVSSKTGGGVSGVTISAKRNTSLPGGEVDKTYTVLTESDGTYAIGGVYYGETTAASGASANFTLTPSKNTHIFDPASLNKTVTQLITTPADANFIDKTVFSVSGTITQKCEDCLGGDITTPVECPIANVELLIDNNYLANNTEANGVYELSMDEQRNYTIKPRYKNHTFAPAQIVLPVGDQPSIENVKFVDNTTHAISGTFTAGCNEFIGSANIVFSQILPEVEGVTPTACFTKSVNTGVGGAYSITLPAGRYRASIGSFTKSGSGSDLNELTVKDFMNDVILLQDSLIRDIDEADKVLNFVYPRPPVLEVLGLLPVCSLTTNVCDPLRPSLPYSLMTQNDSTEFTIKVWQGVAKTCPAKDSIIYLASNIQKDDANEEFEFKNTTGTIVTKLMGGLPNIVCPYYKTFNIHYADVYDRLATDVNKNVVVTGLKSDIGTFTTVSPEIPLKILHDPQGDLSFSFWEANKTSEEAIRFFRESSDEINAWAEIKLGTEFEAGIGVSVETEIWGSIKGALGVGARNATDHESILTISNSQIFSTANNEEVVGSQGDVYIGSALNLLYSKTHILSYTDPCNLVLKADFIIAPDGFATEYVYSEDHIINTVIPTLRAFRDNPANTAPKKAKYSNQVSVWEQIISNNAQNKKRAAFEKNLSFDGAAGPIESITTSSSTKSSTIEFGLEINAELATELGIEIGGSGASGGVVINTKLETGSSTTGVQTQTTTTGYVLDDGDNGDYFSIDIKKDPVYDTPVFQLVAGTSSCPWEEGTQPRDEMTLVCAVNKISNIAANGEAEFTLILSNTSQSGEARTYALTFDQSSNPDGAVVTIGGSPVVGATNYTIAFLGSVQVIVKVKKGAANVFSYTGLRFVLSDACGGDISKSVPLNAFFNSPCSDVTLFSPNNGFGINQNTIPIVIKDYNVANLTNVSMEYAETGSSSWATGFTKTAAQLSTDASGTLVNWSLPSNLKDGKYSFRIKLLCASNVVYSETVTGVIDRSAPILFGNTEPSDDNYVIGDQISATYNENLGCGDISGANLIVKNLNSNTPINAQIGCFQNKIMIVPFASMGATNDSVRVTLQNIPDVYGNIKTSTDSWKFILGTSTAATGNSALSLGTGPAGVSSKTDVTDTKSSILVADISQVENANGTLDFYFTLPANAPNDILINYSVSGSADASNDYTVSFFPNQRLDGRKITSNQFYGTFGTVTILKGQKTAIVKVDPTGDNIFEGNETIIFTVNEGGDYGITNSYSLTGVILNDDGDDCLNGGNEFLLTNNNVSGSAITDGTYHKSIMVSNGQVVSPSNVTIKAAKSVSLNPGFEVKAGSIFKAIIEGCPPAVTAYSIATHNKQNFDASNFLKASFGDATRVESNLISSDITYENTVIAAVTSDKIFFEFKLENADDITLTLLNNFAGEKLRIIDNTNYQAGTYTAEIETKNLKKGDYYIQLISKNKKTYQKVSIK
jgi:hypothetical protein